MAYDIFTDLPLDQSIAGAAWDNGGISWSSAPSTLLVGNGANAVKVPTGTTAVVIGNYTAATGNTGVAVFFQLAAGRDTTSHAIRIVIHSPQSASQSFKGTGIMASIGSYGGVELGSLGGSPAGVNATYALAASTDYCFQLKQTDNPNGLEYTATLYAVSAGVRGAILATLTYSLTTALPGTNTLVQIASANQPQLTISRVETVDAAATNAVPTSPSNIGNISGTDGVAITPVNVAGHFSDTDALTYSASPAGTAWPSGLVINSSTGIISGTVATSTTNGLKVRATDTAAQTVDSNAFNVLIAATAQSTGAFTTDAWTSSGTLRANQSYTGTWYGSGVIGSAGGTPTLKSGNLTAAATAVLTGLPIGPGFFLGKTTDGGVFYQAGTVA